MKIESTDKNIRQILQSGYYKIPRFQRPYSWEKDHIQDFWDDVIQGKEEDYFIGSMVVYKLDKSYFGIVDGQQRLTTITIILSIIRNTLESHGLHDLAKGIHSLIERNNIDNKPEYVLTSESSYPYFQEYIQKFSTRELEISPLSEEEVLQAAFKQLNQLVTQTVTSVITNPSLNEVQKAEELELTLKRLRDKVLDIKLISIELDNEDDAYLIFETLNTRGKDLNSSDLIKNHVTKLMKASNANVDSAKLKWAEMRSIIQSADADINIDSYLHHHWISKYEYSTQKNLFKEAKKIITQENVRNFLENLLKEATVYRTIFEPSFYKWKKEEIEIVQSLEALNLFRVTLQTPVILSLLREYIAGNIKKSSCENTIVSIARFHFLFTAVTSQRSSGGISQMYALIARKIYDAVDTQGKSKIINELIHKLKERVPPREEFIVKFSSIVFTRKYSLQKKLVQYILAGVDKKSRTGTPIDYSQMTIEHLYPENLGAGPKIDDSIMGQMGNLILIDQKLNDKLANKGFQEKVEILKRNNIPLDSIILSATEWNEETIKARTKYLAELCFDNIWKL